MKECQEQEHKMLDNSFHALTQLPSVSILIQSPSSDCQSPTAIVSQAATVVHLAMCTIVTYKLENVTDIVLLHGLGGTTKGPLYDKVAWHCTGSWVAAVAQACTDQMAYIVSTGNSARLVGLLQYACAPESDKRHSRLVTQSKDRYLGAPGRQYLRSFGTANRQKNAGRPRTLHCKDTAECNVKMMVAF